MKLVKFTKVLTVAEVCDTYGLYKEDWYKGTGLYKIDIGSRGEPGWTEFHGNVNEFMMKDTEDFVNELDPTDFKDVNDFEDQKSYLEEYAGLDDSDVDITGMVQVNNSEEEGEDWFLVE